MAKVTSPSDYADEFQSDVMQMDATSLKDLIEAYTSVWDRLQFGWSLVSGHTPTNPVIQSQIATITGALEDEVDRFTRLAEMRTLKGQMNAAEMAFDHASAVGSLRAKAIGTQFFQPHLEGMQAFLGASKHATPIHAMLQDATRGAAVEARKLFSRAIVQGMNPKATAAALHQAMGVPLHRALTIARTEQMRAYRIAAQTSFAKNGHVIQGWIWHSTLDRRTCAVCWGMHGKRFELQEAMGTHPNCRCTPVPDLRPWDQITELNPDQQKALAKIFPDKPTITGAEKFSLQPEAVQKAVLGPTKFGMYKDGVVSLDNLVMTDYKNPFGISRWEASIQDARLAASISPRYGLVKGIMPIGGAGIDVVPDGLKAAPKVINAGNVYSAKLTFPMDDLEFAGQPIKFEGYVAYMGKVDGKPVIHLTKDALPNDIAKLDRAGIAWKRTDKTMDQYTKKAIPATEVKAAVPPPAAVVKKVEEILPPEFVTTKDTLFYHVTFPGAEDSIRARGLLRQSKVGKSFDGGQDLSPQLDGVFLADRKQASILADQVRTETGERPSIYAVEVPKGTKVFQDPAMPESSIIVPGDIPTDRVFRIVTRQLESAADVPLMKNLKPVGEPVKVVKAPTPVSTVSTPPTPIAKEVLHVGAPEKLLKEQEYYLADVVRVDTRPHLNAALREYTDLPVAVKLPAGVLDDVAKDGRLKSAFESNRRETDIGTRVRAEERLLGVPSGAAVGDRPIYGFLRDQPRALVPDADAWWMPNGGTDIYGDMSFKLKPEVRSRSSWSWGDSLDQERRLATPVTDPQWYGIPEMELEEIVGSSRATLGKAIDDAFQVNYLEAQIYGGVSLADVEEIAMREADWKALKLSTRRTLEDAGIKISIVKPEGKTWVKIDSKLQKVELPTVKSTITPEASPQPELALGALERAFIAEENVPEKIIQSVIRESLGPTGRIPQVIVSSRQTAIASYRLGRIEVSSNASRALKSALNAARAGKLGLRQLDAFSTIVHESTHASMTPLARAALERSIGSGAKSLLMKKRAIDLEEGLTEWIARVQTDQVVRRVGWQGPSLKDAKGLSYDQEVLAVDRLIETRYNRLLDSGLSRTEANEALLRDVQRIHSTVGGYEERLAALKKVANKVELPPKTASVRTGGAFLEADKAKQALYDQYDAVNLSVLDDRLIKDTLSNAWDTMGPALRAGNPDALSDAGVSALDRLIRQNPVKHDVKVFRGVRDIEAVLGVDPLESVGTVFTDQAFLFTSPEIDVASSFIKRNDGWIFEIEVPKGTNGFMTSVTAGPEDMDVWGVDRHYDVPSELLLERNLQYEVVAVDDTVRSGKDLWGDPVTYRVIRLRVKS